MQKKSLRRLKHDREFEWELKISEGKPVVSALLSFDMIVLYVAAGLMLLNLITPLGGFVSGLLLYVLLLGVVLCLANNNFTA